MSDCLERARGMAHEMWNTGAPEDRMKWGALAEMVLSCTEAIIEAIEKNQGKK